MTDSLTDRDYRDTLFWNEQGIVADLKFVEREGAMNFYTAYRIHNYHFAMYGAMFLGQYEPAMRAAEGLIETTPEDLLRVESPPMADFIESYFSMKEHVMIRFGKWRELIALPPVADPDLFSVTNAMRLYAKGVAHAALRPDGRHQLVGEVLAFRSKDVRQDTLVGGEAVHLGRCVLNRIEGIEAKTAIAAKVIAEVHA